MFGKGEMYQAMGIMYKQIRFGVLKKIKKKSLIIIFENQ